MTCEHSCCKALRGNPYETLNHAVNLPRPAKIRHYHFHLLLTPQHVENSFKLFRCCNGLLVSGIGSYYRLGT